MQAAQIFEYGGKEVLKTVYDAEKPAPGAGQVLVRVHAAGVNPFDWKVREGYMQQMGKLKFPATLGGDFSGVVAELGEGVSGIEVGDEVYGQAGAMSGHGSYAEFTPVQADSVAPKPASLDFTAAAAVPLTGVSAYQALVVHAKLQDGQKIFIQGGAGGIGTMAVQLAKHLGAHVATTVATKDLAYAESLGADEVIDYTKQDFTEIVHNYDVVYDLAGGEASAALYQVLKKGGTLISMTAQPDEALMEQYGVNMISQFTKVTTERLTKLAELVDQGAIQVHIDKTFPLSEAADALEYVKSGKHHGKVILKVGA
jgi:NADPH:quinone reductase-like Zn-dependent oxidoreductase